MAAIYDLGWPLKIAVQGIRKGDSVQPPVLFPGRAVGGVDCLFIRSCAAVGKKTGDLREAD